MKVALTIAGSDPSGGAGIQADLKTFHQFEVYGMSVITLITVQNSLSVDRVEVLKKDLVREQLEAVLIDIEPDAIKLGALGNRDVIDILATILKKCEVKIVVDPVMVSTQGASLFEEKEVDHFCQQILPLCHLVTPNRKEAEMLSGKKIKSYDDFEKVAAKIQSLGAKNVLIKGGHMEGEMAKDYLQGNGYQVWYQSDRVETQNTHGTGCTLSAAITAMLAKGHPLTASVETAKRYVSRAITEGTGLGKGKGPINHFVSYSQEGALKDR